MKRPERQMPHMTHVVVLSARVLAREAWRALLSEQPGIIVAGMVKGFSERGAFDLGRPAVVLVDVPGPRPALARELKDTWPDLGVLFLVESYDLTGILPLLRSGAGGCLSRDATVGDLSSAITAVGRGEISLPPRVASRALAALARGEEVDDGSKEQLSEREVEILRLLAQGLTNKGIAQTLFLSVRTIEAHLRSIFAKLGVGSRTEAALWAVKRGYGPER